MEAHSEVKMLKSPRVHFWQLVTYSVEKVHTAAAQRTFRRQNVQRTALPSAFGRLAVAYVNAAVARNRFQSQNVIKKTPQPQTTFRS